MEVRDGRPWGFDMREVMAVGTYNPPGTPTQGVSILFRSKQIMRILCASLERAEWLTVFIRDQRRDSVSRGWLDNTFEEIDS